MPITKEQEQRIRHKVLAIDIMDDLYRLVFDKYKAADNHVIRLVITELLEGQRRIAISK